MKIVFGVAKLRILSLTALLIPLFLSGCTGSGGEGASSQSIELTNVSYDPTRGLYEQYDAMFAKYWKEKTGQTVSVVTTHNGSGAQARKVLQGQDADVVTLALGADIDMIAETGLIESDWQQRLPHNSCPYLATIVFLVRKGNPKGIKEWDDLLKPGIEIITPDPETSGGARWNYLAAWGFALRRELGGTFDALNDPAKKAEVDAAQDKAMQFVADMFKNVRSMDTGARGATNRFVQNGQGDVLLAWENEAFYSKNMKPEEGFEIVVPSLSIRCEPPVAVVDSVVKKRGTREVAEAYLDYLYEKEAQRLVAKHFYRPNDPEVLAENKDLFPEIELFGIDEIFGGWAVVQKQHFDGPDCIYGKIRDLNKKK